MPYQQRPSSPSSNPETEYRIDLVGDALAIRRDGAEATVGKLRQAQKVPRKTRPPNRLSQIRCRHLELRSGVRQLKRQLKRQEEKSVAEEKRQQATQELQDLQQQNDNNGK
jgi:hypothetical protein